ncbi:hypothetical protein IV203_012005 [Nitzschia inconspicua]|uniref:Uncharacterized protein n=1 Tax=Nitzschia inconspicua TaxID=303405 RepID=A0A9K3PJB5_9STRA|nr:hypothetical protein IV203_012005 [Nitzschia inconspicua]
MNKTREIEFVPNRSDGFVKVKPMVGTAEKVSSPSPTPGVTKRVIPKKHPPRTTPSEAASAVDRKPSMAGELGPNDTNKILKKHPTRGVSDDRQDTRNSEESDKATIRPNTQARNPPLHGRETSNEFETRKNEANVVKGGPPQKRFPSKGPSENRLAPSNVERVPIKQCPARRSFERQPIKQNSIDKIRSRSIERKQSAPPIMDRSRATARSIERKPSGSISKQNCRARSKERRLSEEPTSRIKIRTRSTEPGQRSQDRFRPMSAERMSKDRTQTGSTERKASKERKRPGSTERKPSKERKRPGSTERKAPKERKRLGSAERKSNKMPMARSVNHRPKSEGLLPYKVPIKELTRKRSKSEDRIARKDSMGNIGTLKLKEIPKKQQAEETSGALPVLREIFNSKRVRDQPNKKNVSRGPEIIELSKESNLPTQETEATAEDSARWRSIEHASNGSCAAVKREGVGVKLLSRAVSFGTVEVNEFPYSIGCDVVSRDGPPLAIAYHRPLRAQSFDLETFERDRRVSRRNREDLLLSEMDRITILQRCGYTAEDIERACWEAEKVRKERCKSIRNKEWDGWNAASESLARKISKISNAKEMLFGSS